MLQSSSPVGGHASVSNGSDGSCFRCLRPGSRVNSCEGRCPPVVSAQCRLKSTSPWRWWILLEGDVKVSLLGVTDPHRSCVTTHRLTTLYPPEAKMYWPIPHLSIWQILVYVCTQHQWRPVKRTPYWSQLPLDRLWYCLYSRAHLYDMSRKCGIFW